VRATRDAPGVVRGYVPSSRPKNLYPMKEKNEQKKSLINLQHLSNPRTPCSQRIEYFSLCFDLESKHATFGYTNLILSKRLSPTAQPFFQSFQGDSFTNTKLTSVNLKPRNKQNVKKPITFACSQSRPSSLTYI
jgi:hypothetical protein